jgi:hypothetical protein
MRKKREASNKLAVSLLDVLLLVDRGSITLVVNRAYITESLHDF